jgi:hypothetical protein
MSRLVCVWLLLLLGTLATSARHVRHDEPDKLPLVVGGLQFQIPASWQAETPATTARAGQWTVPAPADEPGEGVEVVAFFFGPGVGGTAQENIDGWSAAVTTPDGHPTAASPLKRNVAGRAITEVLLTGTYAETSPQPALPPTLRPNYALLGAVIENAGGSVYWRATGPASRVAALAPALDKIIDDLKPQPAVAAAPSP